MASKEQIASTAHLMRRAGFGASRAEIEELAQQRHEDVVEKLVEPGGEPAIDEYALYRYHPMTETLARDILGGQVHWLYHMVNTRRPLEEKMTLFWHHVFATGNTKIMDTYEMTTHVKMFRRLGMGNYKDLLVALAKNPAMIYWLDQNENHKREPNENWGRELLELFSMGVGNYTEDDVKECARAFTGWTSTLKVGGMAWGPVPWLFQYKAEDHDHGDKRFVGHTGNLNGEDVVDVILGQPATPRFIARHLYNFFVADEPQVAAWPFEPARDPEAVETLAVALVDAGYEMKPVLRTLFNSDFFKQAQYQKGQEPGRGRGRHIEAGGRHEGPRPTVARAAAQHGVHGPDTHGPAQRGGLAYRQGVDQQRRVHEPGQLRGGPGQEHRAPRDQGHRPSHRRVQRLAHDRRRAGGPLPGPDRPAHR